MSTNKIKSTNSNSFSEKFFTADLFCDKKQIADYIWKLIHEKNIDKYSEVYINADISKQNWSNYLSGKNIPTKENARRLVIGLQCTLEEAETLLALCGFQFVRGSIADECIKQCIQEGITRMVDVYGRISNAQNVA